MTAETDINTTPTVTDTPVTPVETPIETPIAPAPPTAPVSEPIEPPPPVAPTPAPEPAVPAEPTPTPPAPVAPTPPPPTPAPAPEAENPIKRLLAKAKEKIQFRKQAKLEKIMVFAKAQGSVANDQVEKLLRVSDATASRYLAELVRLGRLKRVGHPRHARYEPA